MMTSLHTQKVSASVKTPGSASVVGKDGVACNVERWLDENSGFAQDYFVRKASQKMVDAWIMCRLTEDNMNNRRKNLNSHSARQLKHQAFSVPNSRKASWTGTPVRKLSSGEWFGENDRQLRNSLQTLITKTLVDEVAGRNSRVKLTNSSHEAPCSYHPDNGQVQGHPGDQIYRQSSQQKKQKLNENHIQRQKSAFQDKRQQQNEKNDLVTIATSTTVDLPPKLQARENERQKFQMETAMEDGSIHENNEMGNLNAEFAVRKTSTSSQLAAPAPSLGYNSNQHHVAIIQQVLRLACRAVGGSQASLVLFDSPFDPEEHLNQTNKLSAQVVCSNVGNRPGSNPVDVDFTPELWTVLQSSEPVHISAIQQIEIPLASAVDIEKLRYPSSVLCKTIKNKDQKIVAVVQLLTSAVTSEKNNADLEIFSEYASCLVTVIDQPCADISRTSKNIDQSELKQMIDLISDLPSSPLDKHLEHTNTSPPVVNEQHHELVHQILGRIFNTFNCSQAQLYIVDEKNADQFNDKLEISGEDTECCRNPPAIARICSNPSGDDEEFVPIPVTDLVGKQTSSESAVIRQPVRTSDGQLLAMIQLTRRSSRSFSQLETALLAYMSGFFALHLIEKNTKQAVESAKLHCEVMREILNHHTICPEEQADNLLSHIKTTNVVIGLDEFHFDDVSLDDQETLKMCWQMFTTRHCLRRFRIEPRRFCRWLITVKQNYRPVVYHNWRHALAVCQTMYALLMRSGWWDRFGDVEGFALLVACLCHDLDHRGTNNSYQHKVRSPLARLYGTSVMENHHFQCCLNLLNFTGIEILSNMGRSEYDRAIEVIEQTILATDLNLHIKNRAHMFGMIEARSFDWASKRHCDALRSCLVTVSDICAVAKPWHVQYRIAKLVAEEFYQQGDMEKEILNIVPLDLMDRDKSDYLPNEQLEFIDGICLPVIKAISGLSPAFEPLLTATEQNRHHWASMTKT